MLKIYARDGWYNVAYHEFVKSTMLGDRAYYKEDQSPICNVFNVGAEPNSSHFTTCRIINALMEHRGQSSPEGTGYVEVPQLIVEFESVFDNARDLISTLNRLTVRHLIEPNTRSTESVTDASHVRVTSAGWYYFRHLMKTFAYLDLVLQDTPLNDSSVEYQLRQSVYNVNNLTDTEGQKVERVAARFERVDRFIRYLEEEEGREREQFGLDTLDTPVAEWIVPRIRSEFETEREWIRKRLAENRERFREEYAYPTYGEEEKEFEDSEEEEEATAEGDA